MEHIKSVHEILDTVQPVRLNHIDGVQDRDDRLKGPHSCIVVHILHNGDVWYGAGLLLRDLTVLYLEVPLRGIYAKIRLTLFVYLFYHTRDLFLPDSAVIDAERSPRIKGVNGYGGTIFFSCFIRENHTYRHTANVHPVCQFLIESVFALGPHILIKCVYTGGNIILSAV